MSRAGNFSCPVLAGVVFLANINPKGVDSQDDMLHALQVWYCCPLPPGGTHKHSARRLQLETEGSLLAALIGQDAASSPVCRAFDGLRDARSLGDAVKKGGPSLPRLGAPASYHPCSICSQTCKGGCICF